MAPASDTREGSGAPAGGEEKQHRGNDLLPFSPPSDLSPCFPHSLSLTSLSSLGGEPGSSIHWTPQGTLPSQLQTTALDAPLPLSQHPQTQMDAAPMPSQEQMSMLSSDRAIWALLQKLPTREDLDSVAVRMETALRWEIVGIKQEMAEVIARVSSLETDTSALRQGVSAVQATYEEVTDQIAQLHLLIDDLENRNRRRNIRIRGLPEATRQADLKLTVTAIFNDFLERPTETPVAIDRVHRTLGPRDPTEDRPRDILCCLHNYSVKEDILQRAWRRGNIDFDGAQITLLPDVSRRTLQMRRCLKPLLEKFGDQGITYKWGHPFHLIARKGGRTYTLRHPADVPAFLSSLRLPLMSLPNWLAFVLPAGHNNTPVISTGRPQRSRRNRRSQRR